MAGTRTGAIVGAARRLCRPVEEHVARVTSGEKWCTRCKRMQPRSDFGRDASRGDGLAAACIASRSTGRPRGWHSLPRVNPVTGRPGPAPAPSRDGDRKQARQRVNVEVRTGRRPRPGSLPCKDCGHLGPERRHEYDHHLGYSAEHHLDVEPVCTICHSARERARGVYPRKTA